MADALAALGEYGDSGDEGEEAGKEAEERAHERSEETAPEPEPHAIMPTVTAAPDVDVAFEAERRRVYPVVSAQESVVMYNPTYENLYAADQGPVAVGETRVTKTCGQNHYLGMVNRTNVHQFAFDDQYHTYGKLGYAANPSAAGTSEVVGDAAKMERTRQRSVFGIKAPTEGARVRDESAVAPRKRLRAGDEYAPYDFALSRDDSEQLKLTSEEQEVVDKRAHERAAAKHAHSGGEGAVAEEKSIFHGKSLTDYQGRTYMYPPVEIRSAVGEHECYIPKECVHTYTGHTKGVAAVRYVPGTGHLILSAGLDSKVKIWDVCNARQCLRTYMGHTAAVRDVCFSNDGRRFLTCSYDRYLKMWDTETGQCLGGWTTRKVPICVKFHPDDDKQNIFLVGQTDKQIVQWDSAGGSDAPIQFYNHHLGAVNTVTFCDQGHRFATTADDKKILVWEYGLPVPFKHISEPHMHSIPAMTLHPNEKWLLGQSMDNQIVVYGVQNNFRQHNRKLFKGHLNAGYACQLDVSPDGQFVVSGDADGKLIFWDWKTTRKFRSIRAHDGVCICATYHPVFPSQVATAGWDGTIKLWE